MRWRRGCPFCRSGWRIFAQHSRRMCGSICILRILFQRRGSKRLFCRPTGRFPSSRNSPSSSHTGWETRVPYSAAATCPASADAIGAEGKHLRIALGTPEHRVAGLYWNHGELAAVLAEESVDIAYVPSINEWQGTYSVQCMVDSILPAACERVFPDRELLRRIYRTLGALRTPTGDISYALPMLTRRISAAEGHISHYTLGCALDIFHELGLLEPLPDSGEKDRPDGRADVPQVLGKRGVGRCQVKRMETLPSI